MKSRFPELLLLFVLFIALGSQAQTTNRARPMLLPESATLPQWPELGSIVPPPGAPVVRSGDLELVHAPEGLGGFVLRVASEPMAIGQTRPMVGYVTQDELKWFDLSTATNHECDVRREPDGIRVKFDCSDPDGARWQINQHFSPGSTSGTIDADIEITVDQDREMAFLPMLLIFPGAHSFGAHKGQGLFAGLEYLEDEPSSSEADVVGPASKRQVPDDLKVTFPLMAIQIQDRYVALSWRMRPQFAPVFDSPDRLFGSDGHVMGVLFPGSDGKNRVAGSLLPRTTTKLHAHEPLALRAVLMGGLGKTVVPAVEQYVASRGWPPLPGANLQLADYVSLAAAGWLDSGIGESNRFHHAIAGGSFPVGPATDAAIWMQWLAKKTSDSALASRLMDGSKAALEAIEPADLNFARVGHVHYPVGALVYGHVAENATRAGEFGHQVLGRFTPESAIEFHPTPGGLDYARTYYTNEANGLTSRSVLDLLEAASFCGDHDLIACGIKELRAMAKFRDGVPRGAQTWECPLHTPDILASANLVHAYTLGYELTGDRDFLDQARYWAWTGVPFVYLVNPTDKPVGLYATIAVYGATQWKAPVWLGLPVQWCGLVYADALYRLVRNDPKGPWKTLADGITLSGIQQSWPVAVARPDNADNKTKTALELQGLLPDSFALREQHRNGPAINPATVQACAAQYFDRTPVYDFFAFRKNSVLVHTPGRIAQPSDQAGRIKFQVQTEVDEPYYVLINGLKRIPKLSINGKTVECSSPHEYHEKEGWLILKLDGKPNVELAL